MILHCVHLRLYPDADRAALHEIMSGLSALQHKLPGMTNFRHGANRDFEGKSMEYPYGFVAEFIDAGAVKAYAEDPEHKALGARLVELCDGGAEGIMVYDLDVAL